MINDRISRMLLNAIEVKLYFWYSTFIMMTIENMENRAAMRGMIDESLNAKSVHPERQQSKLRRERRDLFLAEADRLLRIYGSEQDMLMGGERGHQRITPSIEVIASSGQRLLVQVAEVTSAVTSEFLILEERWTTIQAHKSDTGSEYSLFSVGQTSHRPWGLNPRTTSVIRNSYGGIASNEQVLRGLQAIDFIAYQLAYQYGKN